MKKSDVRVCIVRAPGTNCDAETLDGVRAAGASEASEVVHFNRLHGGNRKLEDYDALIFPGGFSYGDEIRSGVIWARKFSGLLGDELKKFVGAEKPVLGICNGMQVIVESGLLPGLRGVSEAPEACMASNASARYECRWVHLKKTGNCLFANGYAAGEVVEMPVGHAEGKFTLEPGRERKILDELEANKQIVFRYCRADGALARGEYPSSPNASLDDVAGVSNPGGTVFALMPHPDRSCFGWQSRDWTRRGTGADAADAGAGAAEKEGDGLRIFRGLVDYCAKKF